MIILHNMRYLFCIIGIVSMMTLQQVNVFAQSSEEQKIDYWITRSSGKEGFSINGRQITENKYKYIWHHYRYIFAWYNCREHTSITGFKHRETSGIAADIYDAKGQLIHSVYEGYCDVWHDKDANFTMWQKTDLSWYDENGKFIYKGGNVFTGTVDKDGFENTRHEGDYLLPAKTIPNGYFYFIIEDFFDGSFREKKLVLYDNNKSQVGTLPLYGWKTSKAKLIDLSPFGYYFIVDDDCYDLNLHRVPYKYFGGDIMSIIVDGTTRIFYNTYLEGSTYLPHFNNKNIKDACKYKEQGLILIQTVDGNVFDMQGHLLFKTNGKLPSSYDLFDPGNGKYLVWTHDGKNKGVSTFDGKEILAPEFDDVKMLADNLFAFQKSGYWGVLRRTGNANKVIIPLERAYTKIEYSRTLKKYTFEKEGAKGICNANGVQTSITKVAVPVQQQPSQPANNNRPQQQQHPTQGSQSDVKTPVYSPCVICGGTLRCSTCSGQGTNWVGSNKYKCGVCNGTGVCQSCHGTGTSGVIYQ